MAVQVSDFDRFSFTLFMALAVHAVLVLGITFAQPDPTPSAETMEITLSQFDDEEAPEKADFLAQTNQQGSGTEEDKQELTTTQQANVANSEVTPVQPEPPSQVASAQQTERQVVETEAASTHKATTAARDRAQPETDLPQSNKKSLMERSLEIASLEARLDDQMRAYAKKPRVLRVTSVSTLSSTNAWYVNNWINKVERVGNVNYPTEARRAGVYGAVRMLVVLRKDGTVKELQVLESSGSTVLDDAAIRIVRLASPFSSFPEQLSKEKDELEIIRTWSFQRRGLSSG
ncbi:energy transducer TonB [Marinobacter caseinilyticus]|uniref:energy transducer TonB n=1 Tax=Marinobacter caseinilyticus TaxID=2692195 RepID=UPI00140A637E|nr:energy transducer TonB [Marinobacter caseinilyticus]